MPIWNVTVSSAGFFLSRRLVDRGTPWYGFGLPGCCWPFHLHWFYTNTASSHASPEACRVLLCVFWFWFEHQRQNNTPFMCFCQKWNTSICFWQSSWFHTTKQHWHTNLTTKISPQVQVLILLGFLFQITFHVLLGFPNSGPPKKRMDNAKKDAPPTFKRFTTLVTGLVQRSQSNSWHGIHRVVFLGKNLHKKTRKFLWSFLGIQQKNKTTTATTKKHTHTSKSINYNVGFHLKKMFHTEGIAPTFQISGLDQRQKNGTKKSSGWEAIEKILIYLCMYIYIYTFCVF